MRARQRHLNQRFAGAGLVFDSRFINQSDNTAVSTWSDRSGNAWNASQGNPANRPTFQTSEVGGNAIVSFDGNDDFLDISSSALGYFNNVGYGLLVCVVKDRAPTTGDNNHQVLYFSRNGNNTQFRLGIGTRENGLNNFMVGARRLDSDAFTGAIFASNSNYNILSALANYSSGTLSIIVNNKTEQTSSLPSSGNTSATNSDVAVIGGTSLSSAGDAPIDLALLLAFNSSISDALRMRVHRSAALTYKIACN